MKLTLTSAIRHLEKHRLAPEDVIEIDLWGNEGYELQSLARQFEGATFLEDRTDFISSVKNACRNSQVNCLMREIGNADLAIQFIDSYPATDGFNEGANLHVVIMHRKTLQDALRRFAGYLNPLPETEAGLQRIATASRRNGDVHATPVLNGAAA
jgi:hypothetical protein